MARTASTPNKEILEAALQGLEAQKQRLEEQISQVRTLLGGRRPGRPAKSESSAATAPAKKTAAAGRTKRVLSPEARKRIAAAQKKRWAAFRKSSQ